MSNDFLKTFCILLIFLSPPAFAQLSVSSNGRHLINPDGSPFFWLGDTGWGLFQKITREEVDFYLKKRSKQGFTVIHAAAIHKNPFITPELENIYKDKAFLDIEAMTPLITDGDNPANTNEYDYWDHVEYVIDKAQEYQIQIVFLPLFNMVDGNGYNLINQSNAYSYGKFLGERFRKKNNIIWCMGGDVLADNFQKKDVWNLLAKGVNEGVGGDEDYSNTLMTFHTRGGHSSSEYFKGAPWIDFHMLQTWDLYTSIYDAVSKNYNLSPVKPILHGEGAYEDGPEYPTKPITPHKIRKQAYWAVFAGGMHTYGNSNVWSFGSNPKYVTKDWKDAVISKGAGNLRVFQKVFQSFNWWNFQPDNSVILEGRKSKDSLNVSMITRNLDALLCYFSEPSEVVLDLSKITGSNLSVEWINPISGEKSKVGKIDSQDEGKFTTPKGWSDALLFIHSRTK